MVASVARLVEAVEATDDLLPSILRSTKAVGLQVVVLAAGDSLKVVVQEAADQVAEVQTVVALEVDGNLMVVVQEEEAAGMAEGLEVEVPN